MKEEKALNYGKTDVTIETTSVCAKSLISRMNHIDWLHCSYVWRDRVSYGLAVSLFLSI